KKFGSSSKTFRPANPSKSRYERNADFESAVSRICNPQSSRLTGWVRNVGGLPNTIRRYGKICVTQQLPGMKTVLLWLDQRTGYKKILHEALFENVPGGARWRYVWGSTLSFALVVQVITGIFLWMAYSPSSQTAWESVYFIQYEMTGGW